MHRLVVSVIVVTAGLTAVSGQLPCTSALRRLPQFGHLFAHCDCTYSDWTDWYPIERIAVPTSQCPSAHVFKMERVQHALGDSCADKKEHYDMCKYYYDCTIVCYLPIIIVS